MDLYTLCKTAVILGIIFTAIGALGSNHLSQIKSKEDDKIKELEKKARTSSLGIIEEHYTYNGNIRSGSAGRDQLTSTDNPRILEQRLKLSKDYDFPEIIKLSTEVIENTPNWYTPYLFRGIAYGAKGKIEEGKNDIKYIIKNRGQDPEYKSAFDILNDMEEKYPSPE